MWLRATAKSAHARALVRHYTRPSHHGLWSLPASDSTEAIGHLSAFPEWEEANAALKAGKADKAVTALRRIVEVGDSMGPTSAMAVAAKSQLVSAAWEARDYQTGRSTLVQLANALEDDASPHLSDQVNTWLALSSLYLHMGDGNAATRILLKVLSATEDKEEYTLAAAIAHSRFIAAQAVSASMGQSHYDPLGAHTEGHAAWQQLRVSSDDTSDQAMGDVGAAALERNLAAYMYSVGRLGEGQPAGMGFGGHAQLAAMTSRASVDDEGLSSEDAAKAAAALPADECVPADAPCALQAAQEAVSLVPGGLTLVHDVGEDGKPRAPSGEHTPAAHMPSTNKQAWDCALALAHYTLRSVQYATQDTGVTLQQHAEAKKHSKQLLEATAGTLKSVLGSMDDVQLANAEGGEEGAGSGQLLNVPPTQLHADDAAIAHTLHLLAVTAVEQGNAVTAEGLYRAALDKYEAEAAAGRLHPFQARQWMYCANDYSSLLQKWDKRASEGEALLRDVAQRAVKHFAAMGVGDNRAAVSALPWLGEWRLVGGDGVRV